MKKYPGKLIFTRTWHKLCYNKTWMERVKILEINNESIEKSE